MTPHHEEQFTLNQMAPKKRRWLIPVLVGAVVLALGAGAAYWVLRPEVDEAAIAACRDGVRRQLEAPSTAAFTEDKVTERSGATFYVSGVVDAQNGFGAMLRKQYSCIANQSGERWQVVDVSLTDWP